MITGLEPAEPRAPGQMLTVKGTNLCVGTDKLGGQVLLGERVCPTVSRLSAEELVCQVPLGAGVDLPVTIQDGMGASRPTSSELDTTVFFTYRPPVVDTVVPTAGGLVGATVVTILGSLFGAPDETWSVRVGATACAAPVWMSDTSLACTIQPPASVFSGSQVPVTVEVGGQASMQSALFEFVGVTPKVMSIMPSHGAAAGMKLLTLSGTNLTALDQVTVGGQPCLLLGTASAESALCRLGAVMGVGLTVAVRAKGVQAAVALDDTGLRFDVDPPVVSGVVLVGEDIAGPLRFPVMGGSMYIDGFNFGAKSSMTHVSKSVKVGRGGVRQTGLGVFKHVNHARGRICSSHS